MPTTATVCLLRADIPTPTGRIYPRAVLEKSIERFQARDAGTALAGEYEPDGTLLLEKCFGVIQAMRLEDDKVLATIRFTDNPLGKAACALAFSCGVVRSFNVVGTGRIGANNVVEQIDFDGVCFGERALKELGMSFPRLRSVARIKIKRARLRMLDSAFTEVFKF